jgi:hypothetical protein
MSRAPGSPEHCPTHLADARVAALTVPKGDATSPQANGAEVDLDTHAGSVGRDELATAHAQGSVQGAGDSRRCSGLVIDRLIPEITLLIILGE